MVASLFAVLAFPGTAMASKCGDQVLADWFDNGRIDRHYPLHCYEEAIDSIPDDIRDYANAEEVISRALQSAVRGELNTGGCDPSPDGSPDDCKNIGTGSNGNPSNGGNPGSNGGTGGNDGGSEPGDGSSATPDIDTSSGISSVPIPLLVLGGMSLALLAAGGLGYVSRRRHAADGLDETLPGPDDPHLPA